MPMPASVEPTPLPPSELRFDVPLDAQRIHYEELTLRGAFHHTPRTVKTALTFLASGARPWEKLLTHEISLEELPALGEVPVAEGARRHAGVAGPRAAADRSISSRIG